jgi:hypothetical protein
MFAVILCLTGISAQAQLTGTKNIPGDYATIAAAITDLNTQGVGAGGVRFDVAAGYTETITARLNITATGTSGNPIIFEKSGIGANPLITAYVGVSTPSSAAPDGIWSLQGADFVTINGIDLTDPNAANPATMEYGYGLFKNSPIDGAQSDTIMNCVITLNRINNGSSVSPMPEGSVGILVINSIPTTATTSLTPTTVGGTNSSNAFYGNTIQNCNYGIVLNGFAASSPFTLGDTGNNIGGSSASTGNTILNFGGGAATNPSAGIRANNQWSVNISNNTINNNNGAGVNHATTLRGIYAQAGTSANATISNNTVTVNSAATTSILTAIDNGIGSTAASNTINITGNTIQNCTYNTSTTGVFIAINNSSSAATVNITGNNILNNIIAGTGTNPLIETGSPTTANASNNIITGNNRTATSGNLYCIKTTSPTNFTANGNTIDGNSFVTAGSIGTVVGIYSFSSAVNCTENNNIIRNLSVNGSGSIYGMREFGSSGIKNFQNNQIYNLSSTGATPIVGIRESTGSTVTISGNQIYTFSNVGGAAINLSGIELAGGTTHICSKNKIYDLSTSATAPTLNGILVGSGTTVTLSNNIIGDLRATAASAANPVIGVNVTGGTTVNCYYNTIYLNATSSGANFGSSCISASTSPTLDLRNNLFVNLSTANGTGFTVAYRRSSTTLTSFAASSNNNCYYAGTPSATNLIFSDGTNNIQTLAAYQAFVSARDNAAITENPSFVSTIGSSPAFLHINQVSTLLESGGTTIGSVTVDYDNDTRPGPVGSVNGGAIAPDIGADEFDGFPMFCSGTPTAGTASVSAAVCGSGTFNLNLAGASSGPGITYQWQSSATSGGPYTNIIGATTASFTTASISSTTYFVCVVTCTASSSSATSNEVVGTVNPSPTVTVTPNTGSICLPGGSPVTLTANGGVSYTWSPTTGLTPTTGSPVSANPAATTTYTVTGTDASGCTGTATATITVGQNPTISSVTATPPSVCSGGNSQLAAVANSAAPVSAYSFATSTGASLDPMVGATTALGSGDDDTPTASPAAIGFTFPYNGTTYTQFSVSPDGWILLGGTTAAAQFSNAVTSTTNIPKIYPYWDDLATGTTGSVQTLVTGSAPNRILKVQWFITSPRAVGSPANGTFQAWLYETTGVIEFRYGALTASGTNASCGLTASATNFQSVTISSNTTSNSVPNDANAAAPASGRMYTFTPPALSYAWTPATFLSNTTIYNPAATGVTSTTTYTVTVTDAACSSTGTVTITSGSALTATANATPGTTVCEGTNTTLNAVPTGGGAPYTYAWTGPNSFSSTLQNAPLNNITPAQAGTYTCVVTDNCTATFTVNITITVNPAPTVAVTPTSASYCLPGSPVALTASGSATTYGWAPATGLSATTGTNVNASPAASTTYTVTGTDGIGCTATATVAITTSEVPSVISTTATPSTICNGGNSQLLTTAGLTSAYTVSPITYAPIPTPGVGVTTLSNGGVAVTPLTTGSLDDGDWISQPLPFTFMYFGTAYNSFGVSTNGFLFPGTGAPNTFNGYYNAFPSTAACHPSIGTVYADLDFRTAGTINYFVTGTAPYRALVVNWSGGQFFSGSGSLNTQLIIYETTNVIEVHTTNSTGTNSAVEGIQNAAGTTAYTAPGRNSVNWTVTVPDAYRWAPSGGVLTYSWSPATFLSSTTINNPMANAVTASTSYTVTVSNGGCSSTGSVTITSGSTLTAVSSVTPGNTVCEGTNITLSATPSGGGAPYTYSWTGPNSFSSTLQNPAVNGITPAQAGTYTCVVTDNCTSTATVNVTINVNPAPAVAVTPTSALFCSAASPIGLTASGTSTSYAWLPAAGLSATTGTNVNASPTVTTTYTVTGTDGLGCTNTATTTITFAQTPTLSSVTATPASICNGNNSQLNAVASTTSYNVSNPAFTTETCQSTAGPVGDDVVQGPDNIGFSFQYFGNTYTQFGISTNGNIQLGNGSGAANNPTYSTSFSNVAIPATGLPNNMIALAWDDWLTSAGQITYGTIGTSPNRKLIVCFNTTGRGSGSADTLIGQIVLEETTNNVYLNITKKGIQPANTVTEGIENATGTIGYAVSGRNNTAWSTNNNSMLFSPPTISYAWSPTTFLSSSTISNPMANAMTSTTTYTITATASGCPSSNTVTVTVNPTPTVTATAGNSSICNGNSTTLTASGASTYTWMPGSLTGTTVTVSPTSTTTYTVTGVDANGCTSAATTVTITVNPNPTVTATANPSTPVCAGTSVTLTGSGAVSYTWTGGVIDGTGFIPPSTATYTVTGMDGNGCTGTNTITVTVNPLPTVTAVATPTAVCTGSTLTLNGSGATSYSWSGGVVDGVAFTPASTATYTVTGTDANTCSNTATISVVVNPLPTVTANASATTVCDGSSVTLTGSGATSYAWTGGVFDGIAFNATATTTYTVTGTDANGCSGTDMITINVNPLPTVTANATSTTICSGSDEILTGSGTATSYSWSGGVSDGVVFQPTTTTTYTVTGTDGNGCSATDMITINVNPLPVVDLGPDVAQCSGSVMLDAGNPGNTFLWNDNSTSQMLTASFTGIYWVDVTDANGCVKRDSVTITINSNPTVDLGPDATVCGSTVLDAGNPGASYLWSDLSTAQTLTVNASGTYSVTVTYAGGCNASDAINVTVNPLPNVTVTLPLDTVCLNGGNVTLSGESPAGGTWSGTGVTGNSFDPLVPGLGYAQIDYSFTDVNGCSASASDSFWVDICNGIVNTDPSVMTVNAYPNPNTGIFTIEVNNPNADEIRLDIMDVEGRLIYSEQLIGVTNGYTKQIDLRNYANGAYFMRVNAKNDVKTIKLFKQG